MIGMINNLKYRRMIVSYIHLFVLGGIYEEATIFPCALVSAM